jgi:hypothetical protein
MKKESRRESEDRVIADKKKELAFVKSGLFHKLGKDKRKKIEEVAHTLPLECWGAR